MFCNALSLAVLGFALRLGAETPPLSESQQTSLNGAVDGEDHREEAFLALVENVRQWSQDIGDAPIRVNPDFRKLMDDPSCCRGDLCRIMGNLQQQTPLAPPYEDVSEWFVRVDGGLPVMVYVIDAMQGGKIAEHQRIEIDARFYKRVDAVARDGKRHSYPAFVGAHPRAVAPETAPENRGAADRLWMVAGPVGVMMVVFIILMLYVRKKTRGRTVSASLLRGHMAVETNPGMDEHGSLPDDPAEALRELRQRAEKG